MIRGVQSNANQASKVSNFLTTSASFWEGRSTPRLLLIFLCLSLSFSFALTFGFSTVLAAENTSRMSVNSPESQRRLRTDLDLSLAGGQSQNNFKNSSVVDVQMKLNLKYVLNSQFYFDFNPSLSFQSGYVQSMDPTDKSDNRFYIRQAAAHWLPLSSSLLSAGALDQSRWHSSLLIGEQAFPGGRWTQRWISVGPHHFDSMLEGAVPTSSSLSTNTNEKESAPTFVSGGFRWKFNPKLSSSSEIKLTYFSFKNLPLSIATSSVMNGNTPDPEKPNETMDQFLYEYEGIDASSDLRWPVYKSLDLLFVGDWVQNNKAPEGLNLAYKVGGGLGVRVGSQQRLEGTGYYFRTEPDAVVAAYASPDYFRANRVGYAAQADLIFTQSKLKVGVVYSEAEVIFTSPTQSREKNVLLKLEANDVHF